MEAPEGLLTAENVANYFRTTGTQASAHVCCDNDSRVRCVDDADTAWAAPGCNSDGLQLEIAGYMRQSPAQWLDDYSRAALDQAAQQTAEWCRNYGLPARKLTREELRTGRKGITQHSDVSAVYRRSDHTDPGPGFPWDHFLARVQEHLGTTPRPPADTPVEVPEWPGRNLKVTSPYMTGTDVQIWQRQMRTRGWEIAVDGVYGPASQAVAVAFQRQKGLQADGIVGCRTWEAAWTEPIT